MNRNRIGKIHVALPFSFILLKRKECWYNFNASSEEVIVMRPEKMKTKKKKKELATSLRINVFRDTFRRFRLNEHLPTDTYLSYTKCMRSTCKMFIVYAG